MRSYIWAGVLIGSTIGGMIPSLWGDGMFSSWSILLSGIGALLGIWLAYRAYG